MANLIMPLWAWDPPSWLPGLLNVVLALTGILLIGLVLIQRGKGGGLAGAFGGAGGSSAFGSRAGDAFTKATIYLALFWIFLIMGLIKTVQPTTPLNQNKAGVQNQAPADDGGG